MNQIRYSSIPFVFLLLLVCNLEANTPLFKKYANSAINDASLVERQGLKYQVNTTKPFSGRFLGFEDEFGFCVSRAGSYRNGLLHGAYEEYEGCGVLPSYKTGFKNGVEHGRYIEYDEGYLYMEGEMVNGFPLKGTNIVDIVDSDNDGKIELISQLDNNSVISYEIN